jgi:hypothetical protein
MLLLDQDVNLPSKKTLSLLDAVCARLALMATMSNMCILSRPLPFQHLLRLASTRDLTAIVLVDPEYLLVDL